jgi:hypothetical protein
MRIKLVFIFILFYTEITLGYSTRESCVGFDNFDDLILDSNTILLLEHVGTHENSNKSKNKIFKFNVLEVLKGNIENHVIAINKNVVALNQGDFKIWSYDDFLETNIENLQKFLSTGRYSDYDNHTSSKFWNREIANAMWYGCRQGPYNLFKSGEIYLVFYNYLGVDKYAAEWIKNIDEDKWYKYVKDAIRSHNNPLQSDAPKDHH